MTALQIPIDPSNQSPLSGGEELHQIPEEFIQRPFGRRAIWFTEDPYEVKRNQVSALLFHQVFTNDSGSLHSYRLASHLPLAADPALLPTLCRQSPAKLLFFSGTAWPNRKRLLNTLLDYWPNTDAFDLHLVANPFVEKQLVQSGLHQSLRFDEPIAISEFGLRASNSLCTLVVGRVSQVQVDTVMRAVQVLDCLKLGLLAHVSLFMNLKSQICHQVWLRGATI